MKRYGLVTGQTYSWIDESPSGRYVLASDAEAEIAALRARIALASDVADNCYGDYMRLILSGEVDRDEHEARKL